MKKRIIFSILLLLAWGTATYQLIDFSNQFEAMKTIVMSLAGYGVLCTTTLTIWNAWETSKNFAEKINFDKIENSFKFTERWDNNSLKEARDLTRKIKKEKQAISDDELLIRIQGCESTERSVITMFNFFEEIHSSIQHHRVHEPALKSFFSEVYSDIYDRFKVWRTHKKTDGLSSNAMRALDELYERWR